MIIDLTVAVTAHSETVVAGPTMASAEAAIQAVESAGYRVERLIGLDAASDHCRAFFMQNALKKWRTVDLGQRDLGLARNALAKIAKGQWIAFLDADDLFSENWLLEGTKMLIAAGAVGEKKILHPEVNLFFDAANSVLTNISQDDELFVSHYWYAANYFDSLTMASKKAFLDVPYVGRDREKGYAYEDWRWNLDTILAGWRHTVVKDTIIFKRRQDTSLVTELSQRRSLLWDIELMAVDVIREVNLMFSEN